MVGVSAALEGGKYSWDNLWLLPPNIPNAQRTAALVQNGGVLTVTMQAPDDDLAEEAGERFEDAMMLLEESTVAD